MSFDLLVEEARALSRIPHAPAPSPAPEILDAIGYDEHHAIRHPLDAALHADSRRPVTFFHLGKLFRRPVRMFSLDGGSAREIRYDKELFAYPPGNPAARMPEGAGFAGFRVHDAGHQGDWAAFLGASYFRSSGDAGQYGISARGVAVDTAPPPGRVEEFPDFTRFYIGPEVDGVMTVLALLEGESLTGAYRFELRREPVITMDVECVLHLRRPVGQLGIAPLTSMYWYSETNKWAGADWRPEVHDSDGLMLWTGTGEQIWRPLLNARRVCLSAFHDVSPKGFGLIQRDRDFANYRDEVAFERRPNLWVQPRGDWGAGAVHLVEIPTVHEYDDNIVAMWVPSHPTAAGQELRFSYRLHWSASDPCPAGLARCTATRTSKPVIVPEAHRSPGIPALQRQFVLEFDGPILKGRDPAKASVDLSSSHGVFEDVAVRPAADKGPGPWRVYFRVYAEGGDPAELRLRLKEGDTLLSESWFYQYHPTGPGDV